MTLITLAHTSVNFLFWLCKLVFGTPSSAFAQRNRLNILCLEELEPRVVPATITWQGGQANPDWSFEKNWVGNVAPGPGDTVVFDGGRSSANSVANIPTISTITVKNGYSGTITLNDNLSVTNSLFFDGADCATLLGQNNSVTLSINGTFTWNDGVISTLSLNLGNVLTKATATTTIGGDSEKFLVNDNVVNRKGSNLTWQSGNLMFRSGTSISNYGNIVIQAAATLDATGSGGSVIVNYDNGILTVNPGANNTTVILGDVSNSKNTSSVVLQSGTLSVQRYIQTGGTTNLAGGSLSCRVP